MSIGTQERDFFRRELLSKYIKKLLSKSVWPYKLINVGSCTPRTVLDLAQEHKQLANSRIKLKPGGIEIPWYEPTSFFAQHTSKIKSFLS